MVEKFGKLVLVLEAVLSIYYDEHGNPDIRGDFEKGRGWYWGPKAGEISTILRATLPKVPQDTPNKQVSEHYKLSARRYLG